MIGGMKVGTIPVRTTIGAVLLIASTIGASAPAPAVLPVTAYQEEGDATSLIDASAPAIGSVGVDGVNINSQGTGVATPDSAATAQLARAHSLGLRRQVRRSGVRGFRKEIRRRDGLAGRAIAFMPAGPG